MGKKFARGGMLKNPNFQRSLGTDRSVGTQMQSADRKAKEVLGGGRPIGIAKQNTNHGKLDLPVAGLNKYAGHKKGGIMRKGKRFDDGGIAEGPNANIDDDTRARAMRWVQQQQDSGTSQSAATPRAAPRPAAQATPRPASKADDSDAVSRNTSRKDYGDSDAVSRNVGRRFNADTSQRYPSSMPSKAEDTGPYIGYRATSRALGNRTPAEKEAASERVGEVLGAAASLSPMGRAVGAGKAAYSGVKAAGAAKKAETPAASVSKITDLNESSPVRSAASRSGEHMKEASRKAKFSRTQGLEKNQTRNLDLDKKGPEGWGGGLKKGGKVGESKKMVQKEVSFFKKKGAPKSMIKHEQAEAKSMKYAKGGSIMRSKKDIANDQMKMAPYAKGGNVKGYMANHGFENRTTNGTSRAGENTKVQKKGLTEGRVVKMATGGVVKFARGGGIESRGKTRGKMC
jgi:hypothetical protein